MSQDIKNPAEDKLDAMLKAQAIQAQPDFVARTLDRIHLEVDTEDEKLDALLAHKPLQTSATFTHETLRRARRPNILLTFGGYAAAAALALGFVHIVNLPQIQTNLPYHPTVAATSQARPTSRLAASAIDDPTLSELIALATPLADVAPLLDPDALVALNTLTRWQP